MNEDPDKRQLYARIQEIFRTVQEDKSLNIFELSLEVIQDSNNEKNLQALKNLFFALGDKQIDKGQFCDLTRILKNLTRDDLEFIELNARENPGYSDDEARQHLNLIRQGILTIHGLNTKYHFTLIAQVLDRYALSCDVTASYKKPEQNINFGTLDGYEIMSNEDIEALFKNDKQ